MANYNKLNFRRNDDIPTPLDIWKELEDFIPKDKKIWCPFYYNGELTLKKINNNIIHTQENFYEYEPEEYDLIIDNPPFSCIPDIFKRLFELDKPFLIILPISKLRTKYSRKYLKDRKNITIIYPSYRFNFLKDKKSSCGFETIALTYKMNLKKENIWI